MVNAVILAGDRVTGDRVTGDRVTGAINSENSNTGCIESKALIKIHDRFMIEYIIDSIRRVKCVDKIVVVGSQLLDSAIGDRVDAVLGSGTSIIYNLKTAIEYLNDKKHIIVCTCDIPMVSEEAIEDFIKQCSDRHADIGYPIIEKSLNDNKYPDVKRTYVRMKDGIFTGGNIIYVNPQSMERCYKIADQLVGERKNAVKMGRIIGIWTLIRLCLGILSISSVEKRVNRLYGINARAIKTLYPEIGNDVDKADDVEFVKKYMSL